MREYTASTVRAAILESHEIYTAETAPQDDEPETEAERNAVAEARQDARPDLNVDEVKRRLPL